MAALLKKIDDASCRVKTTVGELASAYYEEALLEFGDRQIAQRVAAEMLLAAIDRRDEAKRSPAQHVR